VLGEGPALTGHSHVAGRLHRLVRVSALLQSCRDTLSSGMPQKDPSCPANATSPLSAIAALRPWAELTVSRVQGGATVASLHLPVHPRRLQVDRQCYSTPLWRLAKPPITLTCWCPVGASLVQPYYIPTSPELYPAASRVYLGGNACPEWGRATWVGGCHPRCHPFKAPAASAKEYRFGVALTCSTSLRDATLWEPSPITCRG
jgi:hypothetical protein